MRSSLFLTLLPLLAIGIGSQTASAEPRLSVKSVDAQKRGGTNQQDKRQGSYVSSYSQCLDVCNSYFGTPAAGSSSSVKSTSSFAANNNAVQSSTTTTTIPSSKPVTSTTTSKSTTLTTIPNSKTSTTTSTTTTVSRAPSAIISSATTTSAAIKPSSTGSTGTAPVTSAQQQTILTMHNNERAKYGASALVWNATLATYAQTYASKCVWQHSGGPYGENLAASYGYPDAVTTGINGWISEAPSYDYNNPNYSHWTQMVWKGSSSIGCAMVKCAAGAIQPGWGITDYLVCEYHKPGNVLGQFPANVGRAV